MKKTEKSNTNEIIEIPAEEAPYALPDGWKWVRIKDVAKRIFAGGDKPEDFQEVIDSEHMIPVVGNGLVNEGILGYTSKATAKSNTVTVAGRGTIGFAFYRKYDYCPIVRLIVIEHLDCIIPKFLMLFLSSIEHKSNGSSIPQLTVPMLKTRLIPLPPLETQQRIVERIESLFAKLDEAKEKAQTALDGFELRKSAILHKAFTGQLTAQWRSSCRPSDISSAPAHIESAPADISSSAPAEHIDNDASITAEHFVNISSVTNSLFSNTKQSTAATVEQALPNSWRRMKLGDLLLPMKTKKPEGNTFRYIDIDSIDNINQKVKEPKILKTSEAPSRASRAVENGNILFSMVRPYLKNIALIDSSLSDCIASTGFYVCRCHDELFSNFLYHLLCSKDSIDYLMQFMKGDNSPSIRKDDLLNMPINLPPLSEQQEIVRILDDLLAKENAAKEAAEAVIEKIDLMKKSILARAFRGEL